MPSDYEILLSTLRSRRSIRAFRPEPVAPPLVDQLLEAARWAPSAGNRQPYRFIVVSSPAELAAMSSAVRASVESIRHALRADVQRTAGAYLDSFLHFDVAPLCIVPIHRAGLDLLGRSLEASAGSGRAAVRGGQAELDALCSVSAAIQNLLLAAHTLGLGACWMTGPLVAASALGEILRVPAGWTLSALIPIGYPAEAPEPPARRPLERLRLGAARAPHRPSTR
jgi:nitroreductase